MDPNKKEERDNQTRNAIRHYDEDFGQIDLKKSYLALFELLWYGQMPCTDVRGVTSETKDELSFIKKFGLPAGTSTSFPKHTYRSIQLLLP